MIGTEPVELMMSNTELILKYVHEDIVVDRIIAALRSSSTNAETKPWSVEHTMSL